MGRRPPTNRPLPRRPRMARRPAAMEDRRPAGMVPRPGPSAEQTIRTRIMGERGLFTAIHPHKLTADNLAEAIAGYLRQTTPLDDARIPPLDGASRAAALMLGAPLEAA